MPAFLEAYRAGLFGRAHWWPNVLSGVIVGVVALPLAMAFAIASGARPEQGLYTAIVAGAVVAVFGGSRVQIAGPTGAFVVVLADVTARHGIEGLQIATLMAGGMLIAFGVLRFGAVIKFIPDPVIVGFTAGIAVIIWVGQWPAFFGLPPAEGDHFLERLWGLLGALAHPHPATTALALLSLVLVLATPRIRALGRVPGPLVALLVATALQALFQFDGVATIGGAFGGIPQGLPAFRWPSATPEQLAELVGPAFTIAMLGAIESLLSAVVADGMAGTRHDANQELIGQGLANVLAPLFGGFAATGAIARTATNIRNGATSPLSGVVHSLTLLLVIVSFAPLAADIPLAALAAILFVVAWNMSQARHFLHIVRRAPRADVVVLLATFVLTLLTDLVVAVNIGIILATLNFMRKMADSVEVRAASEGELAAELAACGVERLPDDVVVYVVDGPFFFGAMETFERALSGTQSTPRVLIIRLKWVPFIDLTGLQTLEDVIRALHRRGVRVILSGANERVRRKLIRAGIVRLIGVDNLKATFAEAVAAALPQDEAAAPA